MDRLHASLLAAFAGLALVGCETEPAGEATIAVTPTYAAIMANQSCVLAASGGWDFFWQLDNPAAGYLDKTTGPQVVYTAVRNNVTQLVTVTGTAGSGTSIAVSARATIVQGGRAYAQSAPKPSATNTPAIRPPNAGGAGNADAPGGAASLAWDSAPPDTLAVGQTATVSVKGHTGAGNVRWSTPSDSGLALSSRTGHTIQVTGTAPRPGGAGWSLIVIDSGSGSQLAHVIAVRRP